jgi:hypothetical protein
MWKNSEQHKAWSKAYNATYSKTPLAKYHVHRQDAKRRGIPFLMSFEEWWTVWQISGKWDERGPRKGQYVMARFGDAGAYERDNVKICPVRENMAERNKNHPYSAWPLSRWQKVATAK